MAGQPIRPNPAPLEIYFLPGVDPGKKSSTRVYQKIFEGTIGPGAGRGNATILPELANPVVIPAGSSYSFYITFTNSTLGTMYLKSVSSVGSVAASDEYVDVLDGYAMLYPFSMYSPGWRWNGEVHIFKISNGIFGLTLIVSPFCAQAMCTTLSRPRRLHRQRVIPPLHRRAFQQPPSQIP